jgi:hypothetical protein
MFFFAIIRLFFEDLPCSWPWGIKIADTAENTEAPLKGMGRGRGRGKNAKGRGKGGKPGGDDDEKSNKDKDRDKDDKDPKKKVPSLLTNLVRTGNQMSGASTWSILCKALDMLVCEKLQLLPISQIPADAPARLKWNQGILKLLGKLPQEFDLEKFDSNPEQYLDGKKRFPAMLESAVEFLRLGRGSSK